MRLNQTSVLPQRNYIRFISDEKWVRNENYKLGTCNNARLHWKIYESYSWYLRAFNVKSNFKKSDWWNQRQKVSSRKSLVFFSDFLYVTIEKSCSFPKWASVLTESFFYLKVSHIQSKKLVMAVVINYNRTNCLLKITAGCYNYVKKSKDANSQIRKL